MASLNPTVRVMHARIAAHEKWAATPDRSAATAPARKAFADRFVRQAAERFPDLTPAQLVPIAENLRRAHYTRMALRSAEARRARTSVA